jgi:autotransporter-associated beta strand protein
MSTRRRTPLIGYKAHLALQAALLSAVAGLAMPSAAHADTNYYYGGTTTGTWDTTSPIWATPLSSSSLGDWVSSSTSDAYFPSTLASANITLSGPITANIVSFSQTGTAAINGTSTLTLNQINNNVAGQTINFFTPLQSSGQLVIQGVTGTTNGKGVSLLANTNQLNGGVLLTGGSVYFNFGNTAPRFEVDPTHAGSLPFSSPTGFNGSTVQTGPIILTTVSGVDSNGNTTYPAITVNGNHSSLTLASIHTNDYVVPNPIVLNTANVSNFYVGMGAGSVADSGTVGAGPYPAYATMNFAGQISGNGNIIISNDFYGGGGKGFTIFSNSSNNYTGKTIINNNGQNYMTFQIGAQNAVPATSDVVFGASSYGQSIGANSISSKQVGAMDLNGFDVTIKSLSSDLASTVSALGITSVNNHGINPDLTSGPHATDGTNTSTLTIDSAGSFNNTFFQGNISDGTTFLTQSYSSTGSYPGNYTSAAASYLNAAANGVKIALNLAATNTGVLTLTATNGSIGNVTNVPEYGYTGGTTVRGGSLYVNGPLSAAAGSSADGVLVTTPTTGNVAVLGGTGSILPDTHIQSGATLAPGSAPAPLSTGSGSSFTSLPTAFNTGTLTVHNLTMDGGSQLNFVINDGSTGAIAGVGYGSLAFSTGGSFTESSSVTASSPIYVHPLGTFAGFSNYKTATWTLGNFPSGTSLANIALDSRSGYSPLPSALLANGTFSVTEVGTALDLVFTPSATVTALQYAGPSAGTWNTSGTNAIWTDLVHGTGNVSYSDPGNVLFATPTANTSITIQSAGVSPASVIFNNAATSGATAVSYTLTGGSINGGAPLSLNGTGHVILTAANAYTGGTGISGGGTLETQVSGALGTGTVSLYNGIWETTTNDQSDTLNVQTLGSATASPATVSTIQTGPLTGAASGNLTLTGSIAGGGTLTKTGTGTLTVIGSLTQNGGLNVNGGTLVINGAAAYTGATSVLANASIEYQTPANTVIPFSAVSTLAGNLIFDNLSTVTFSPGTYSANGTLVVKASGTQIQGTGGIIGGNPVDIGNTINLNPANTPGFIAYVGMAGNGNLFWLHGAITGNSDVDFGAGPGQGGGAFINLYAQNTYTGNTYITTGGKSYVTLQTDNALPVTTNLVLGVGGSGSGIFDLNGHNQTVASIATDPLGGGFGGIEDSSGGGSLTVNGSTNTEFNALIAGIFTLNVALQNNAILKLSYNGNNAGVSNGNVYGGLTNVTSGVLEISNPLAFSPYQNLTLDGGVLEIHAHGYQSTSNPNGTFTNSLGGGANQVEVTGGVSGFSSYGAVPGSFNFNGDGSTIVWGSSYFQPTVLVLNQTTAQEPLDFQNGLDLNGTDRSITVNSTLAGTAATVSGTIINSTGTAGLVKLGAGTLILSAANTYNGNTTISAGTLLVSNTSGSGTGTGNVLLNGGTLGGTGFISGKVVAGTSAHTINPGLVSSVGTLTVGGLTTNANTTLQFDLTTPTAASDKLIVLGNLTLGGGTIAVNLGTTGAASLGYYPVLSYSSLSGSVSSLVLPATANNIEYTLDTTQTPGSLDLHRGFIGDANDDGKVDLSDLNIVLNNLGTTNSSWTKGNFDRATTIDLTDLNDVLNHLGTSIASGSAVVAPSAVPEPASLGLLALGAAALIARRRKA